jgi:hypothetical protein
MPATRGLNEHDHPVQPHDGRAVPRNVGGTVVHYEMDEDTVSLASASAAASRSTIERWVPLRLNRS